jgi:hypothetical protein
MRITVGQLRALFREGLELEAKISASPDFLKKERVREQLQKIIAAAVASGEITDEASLQRFMNDINTSMIALKMIPFDVWKKLSHASK